MSRTRIVFSPLTCGKPTTFTSEESPGTAAKSLVAPTRSVSYCSRVGRGATRALPRLGAVLAVLLPVVAIGGGASPASAIPTIEYFGEEIEVKVNNPVAELCIGENHIVFVDVAQYGLYRDGATQLNVPRPHIYRTASTLGAFSLNAQVSSPGAADISLINEDLSTSSAQYEFRVTGRDVGPTVVSFDAASNGGVTSLNASMSVQVTECDYQVHVFSIWHIHIGRNIVAGSSIDTIISHAGGTTAAPLFSNVHAPVDSDAVSFLPPCQALYHLPRVEGAVLGELHDDVLTITVLYPDNQATTGVKCPRVVGAQQDPATLDPIDFNGMDGGGGSDSGPQVLHAPGAGDFTGMTYVDVTPIHIIP